METNWERFYKETSQRQYFFIYSKDGWRFNKGYFKGHLLEDLKELNEQQLKDYLEDLYRNENTTAHTRMVIKEIIIDVFKKNKPTK